MATINCAMGSFFSFNPFNFLIVRKESDELFSGNSAQNAIPSHSYPLFIAGCSDHYLFDQGNEADLSAFVSQNEGNILGKCFGNQTDDI
jgi:hypothetical protein